jgi:lactoylglutathione lyase
MDETKINIMKIEHIGICVKNINLMTNFYKKYFNAVEGKHYHNPLKYFTSCFVEFPSGARIELMHNPLIPDLKDNNGNQYQGYVHIAVAVGNEQEVDRLTLQLKNDGYRVLDGPRRTGDGYYESVILDPEGNRIELTV